MCLAVPARIVTTDNQHAQVETMGFNHRVNIALVEDVMPGDYILVHAGFAIARIDPEEARETLQLMRELFDPQDMA